MLEALTSYLYEKLLSSVKRLKLLRSSSVTAIKVKSHSYTTKIRQNLFRKRASYTKNLFSCVTINLHERQILISYTKFNTSTFINLSVLLSISFSIFISCAK